MASWPCGSGVRVEEGRRELRRSTMRGHGPFLLDLGQTGGDLPGDLVLGERGLGQALAQQVQPVGEVVLGHVELDGQP